MQFLAAALRGDCPRCGERTLFESWVAFAPRCRACGLDFSAFNVGDGPAAFLILIVGAILTAAAITVELTWQAPDHVPRPSPAPVLNSRAMSSALASLSPPMVSAAPTGIQARCTQ